MELDFEDEPTVSGKITGVKARQAASGNDTTAKTMKNVDKPRRRITEIKVYYDDLTYESFVPEKK